MQIYLLEPGSGRKRQQRQQQRRQRWVALLPQRRRQRNLLGNEQQRRQRFRGGRQQRRLPQHQRRHHESVQRGGSADVADVSAEQQHSDVAFVGADLVGGGAAQPDAVALAHHARNIGIVALGSRSVHAEYGKWNGFIMK